MPDAPPPNDVAAILAELDRRLQDLEAELAAVGAVAPQAPAAEPAPATSPATEPAAEPAPGAGAEADRDAPAPDPADAALDAIRRATDHEVEVVARAPDALVLRVDLRADVDR